MRFRNPSNGYEEEVSNAWLWCLLFGSVYFAAKGVMTHAIASLVLAICTCSLSWFIYPIFAREIIEKHYLRAGWLPVAGNSSGSVAVRIARDIPPNPTRVFAAKTADGPSLLFASVAAVLSGAVLIFAGSTSLFFGARYFWVHGIRQGPELGLAVAVCVIDVTVIIGSIMLVKRGLRKERIGILGWAAILFVGAAAASAALQGLTQTDTPQAPSSHSLTR